MFIYGITDAWISLAITLLPIRVITHRRCSFFHHIQTWGPTITSPIIRPQHQCINSRHNTIFWLAQQDIKYDNYASYWTISTNNALILLFSWILIPIVDVCCFCILIDMCEAYGVQARALFIQQNRRSSEEFWCKYSQK